MQRDATGMVTLADRSLLSRAPRVLFKLSTENLGVAVALFFQMPSYQQARGIFADDDVGYVFSRTG